MHPGALWLTGLPGSGKSTIAEEMKRLHPDFVVLRLDALRKVVTPEPTYSPSERDIVYRCLVYTARTLVEYGHTVVIDATGHLRRWRELARSMIPGYCEVYLKCPVEVCVIREREREETHGAPREIYAKGEAGWPVPGISALYEEPVNPELLVEVDKIPLHETVKLIDGLFGKKRMCSE
ncbi:MAG: adenylyl-sulfate kinase [Thermodesulfovibrionales bacterium]|jgi:adenylylsulfate kinase